MLKLFCFEEGAPFCSTQLHRQITYMLNNPKNYLTLALSD